LKLISVLEERRDHTCSSKQDEQIKKKGGSKAVSEQFLKKRNVPLRREESKRGNRGEKTNGKNSARGKGKAEASGWLNGAWAGGEGRSYLGGDI